MDYKCKCNNIGSKYCINKYCKNCCKNNKCKIHTNNIICNICNIKNFSKKCSDYRCIDCCNKKNCKDRIHKDKYKKCSICKIKNFDTKCFDTKCFDCCSNILCIKHEDKFNKCIKCKIKKYNCEDKYCLDCCDNNDCKIHYILCKCNEKIINHYCNEKMCKTCCKDLNCFEHYIQDYTLSNKILNNYKIELYKLNKFPFEIINIIIDDYVDAREKCCICFYKFIFDYDIDNGNVISCEVCNKWTCSTWCGNDCSKSINYNNYSIEYYCIECYNELSSDVSDDNSI